MSDKSVQIIAGDLESFEGFEGLTPKQARFVQEYCVDYNGTQAAVRAGYSENTAAEQSYDLLRKPQIRKAIADRMVAAAKAAGVDATLVISELYDLVTSDPRELCRTEIDSCRYCYGIGHEYQWTQPEYTEALEEALRTGKPAPGLKGGFGFDPRKEPLPECPGCHGRGVPTVIFTASRKLSRGAAKLLSSIKQAKDGSIETKLRDQDKALELLGRVCGVFRDRQEFSGPNGTPLQVAPAPPINTLTNEQLEDILRKQGRPLPPKQLTEGGSQQ